MGHVIPNLKNKQGIVIDTNVLIYLFEDDPLFGDAAEKVIMQAEQGVFHGVITPITVAELLVKPLRNNREDLANRCRSALRRLQNIDLVGLSFKTGEIAGALRAQYGFPLPDMMQVAVALESKTPAIITNDKALKKIKEIDVILLSDIT